MIEIGRNIRWDIPYEAEVVFSKKIECAFMQIWFLRGEILIESRGKDKIELIKECGFPIVIHAVIDVMDFEEDVKNVLPILKELKLSELIIHPTCKKREIDDKTIYKLRDKVNLASNQLANEGIKLYVENNCRVTPINYSSEDISIVFEGDSEKSLLLDIAHVDSYKHLEEIINIKYPRMLHLADKHFDVDHEHLPIGEGELDFNIVFQNYLRKFNGKLILEITQDDRTIEESVKKIKHLLTNRI